MFTSRNLLFCAFIVNRRWCNYIQMEQQRKYAAVIIGHCFFSCYTPSYLKAQEAWTNVIWVHLSLIVIHVYLNKPLILCVSLRKSFTIIANEL